jgi:Predicted nucleoside-diphosphate-sugar epimerases
VILVTGASGTVGKEVLKQVAKSGAKYRAMYRSAAEAAKAPPGASTVVADFAKKETLAAALGGVSQVYLVCSPLPNLVELEGNTIDACVEAGVEHVVLNSALGAGDFDTSFPAWHRKVEDKLRSTRLSWTILRPNSFHQNTVTYYAPSIRRQGVFYGSLQDARLSYLDVRDVAGAAAKALAGKEHTGKIYELNGPEALTSSEIAGKIAKHAGRPVEYVDIPMEAQRKSMVDLGMPEWQVTALLELQQYYVSGRGGEVDRVLENLLGQPPMTMDQFLAENAAAFRAQAAKA